MCSAPSERGAPAGNDAITGGSGHNTVYAGSGSGSDTITGGGNDVIQGGPGTNTLIGGAGLDEITGGSGANFIYGNGQHDVLMGGSGPNYILPKADNGGNLASLEVEKPGTKGAPDPYGNPSDYYYENLGTDAGDFTFDGNVKEDGTAYRADCAPGYGGLWDFHDFDSGVRLGEDSVTAVAVYATWREDQLPPVNWRWASGTWESDAVYEITGTADGQTHKVYVDQAESPGHDSPEPKDQPWKLLGVFNVEVGGTLTVKLVYDTPTGEIGGNPDGPLCVSDVMIHPLWPTVDIQRTDVTVNPKAADASGYVDWFDAWNPAGVSPEAGSGSRTQFQLTAQVDPLFAQAPPYNGAAWNWTAKMPAVAGLEYWQDSQSGTPWQQNQAIAPGAPWTGTVWASTDPNNPPATDPFPVTLLLDPPGGAHVGTTDEAERPRGGRDITVDLEKGLKRLNEVYTRLPVPERVLIATTLVNPVTCLYAWDIPTLKGDGPLRNGICDKDGGIDTSGVGYTVTVNGEVYPAQVVNYVLFGRLMRLVYGDYPTLERWVYDHNTVLGSNLLGKISYFLTSRRSDYSLDTAVHLAWINRTVTTNMDHGGVNAALAFVKDGYLGGWENSSGLGLKGFRPSDRQYKGTLEWRVGPTDRLWAVAWQYYTDPDFKEANNKSVLDFFQGPDYRNSYYKP